MPVKASFLDGLFAGQAVELPAAFLTIIVSERLDPSAATKHVQDPAITETRGGEQNVLIVGNEPPWTRYTLGLVNDKKGGLHLYHVVETGDHSSKDRAA